MSVPGLPTDATVTIRFAADLRLFLPARHRGGNVSVRHDGTSSLGHVVESLGVPLPEVGRLTANDEEVAPSYRPRAGDEIGVEAVRRPQPLPMSPPRLLLDVHLGTLARRLRLLGVDAAYRNDADDDALVHQAREEGQVLLTQDRGLLRRRALPMGAYVRGSRPADQLADVLDRFDLALTPYTRCTACNGNLAPVAKRDVADRLEPGTLRSYDEFARCRDCGAVYWHGAHGDRLDALVRAATERADVSDASRD